VSDVKKKRARLVDIINFGAKDIDFRDDNYYVDELKIFDEYEIFDSSLKEYVDILDYFEGYEIIAAQEAETTLYVLTINEQGDLVLWIFKREE
jgi:hypothetical protein